MLTTVALALFAAASSPSDQTCRPPSSSRLATLERAKPERVQWKVAVDGEVARLTARVTVALGRGGPSLLELETDPDRRHTTLRRAKVRFAGTTTRATLQAPTQAKESFDTFVYALRAGSKPGTTSSGRPAAAILAEEVSPRFGKIVRVAFPCDESGGPAVVELEYASLGTPVAGGIRFAIPPVGLEVVDDIPLVDEVLVYAPGAITPALFAANASPQKRSSREKQVRVSHRDDERFFTVARPEGNRLAPTGGYAFVKSDRGGITAIAAGLSLPSPLTTLKGPAHLVFVVDKSASFGAERQAAAFALANGIFAQAPAGSRFSTIEFGRYATLTDARATDPRSLLARSMTPRAENGSALVEALALAKRVSGDAAPEEVTRVVVMTDLEQAQRVSMASVREAFGQQPAVTHLVRFDESVTADAIRTTSFSFSRRATPSIVDATGGIEVDLSEASGGESLSGRQSREARRASGALLLRHLLSPQLVEGVALSADGMPSDKSGVFLAPESEPGEIDSISTPPLVAMNADEMRESSFPLALSAGENVRVLAAVRGRVGHPTFFGTLWNDRVALPLRVAPRVVDVVPGVVANFAAVDLSDVEGQELSRRGHAVSRFLSLLGLPSWRPPVVEDRIENHGISGWGCGCGGCGGHSFGTSCAGARLAIDRYEITLLAQRLKEAIGACGAKPSLQVRIEVARREILDVTVVENAEERSLDRARSCVTEAMWRTSLDELVDNHFERIAGESANARSREDQFQPARTFDVAMDSTDVRLPKPAVNFGRKSPVEHDDAREILRADNPIEAPANEGKGDGSRVRSVPMRP